MRQRILRCLLLLGCGLVVVASAQGSRERAVAPTTDFDPDLISSAVELSRNGRQHPCDLLEPWRRRTVLRKKPLAAMSVWLHDPLACAASAAARASKDSPLPSTPHDVAAKWVSFASDTLTVEVVVRTRKTSDTVPAPRSVTIVTDGGRVFEGNRISASPGRVTGPRLCPTPLTLANCLRWKRAIDDPTFRLTHAADHPAARRRPNAPASKSVPTTMSLPESPGGPVFTSGVYPASASFYGSRYSDDDELEEVAAGLQAEGVAIMGAMVGVGLVVDALLDKRKEKRGRRLTRRFIYAFPRSVDGRQIIGPDTTGVALTADWGDTWHGNRGAVHWEFRPPRAADTPDSRE